jgi:hypothetical protein
MSAVEATAAAHPRPAPASEARALGPSRRNTRSGKLPISGPSSGGWRGGRGSNCAVVVIGSCGKEYQDVAAARALATAAAAAVAGRALPWRGALLGNPLLTTRSFGRSVPRSWQL